jgi:hypothetical protein
MEEEGRQAEAEVTAGLVGGDPGLESPIPETLRPALAELEAFLDDEPPERLSQHVLVLASSWVLPAAGFDLERYSREARSFYQLTPQHDRVLTSFPDAIASYLVYRLMTNDAEELEPEVAAERLAHVKAELGVRAEWTEHEYPLVARGFRCLLEETEGGTPPYDPLWHALARRIGDRGLPEWQLRAAR